MKTVKLFDDYLQMAADANQMTREEYTATYLSERNLDINRYSPMAYAQRVLDGQMEIIDAAKQSGLGISGLIKLIKKLDKNFKWSLNEEEGDTLTQLNDMTLGQLERIEDYAEMIADRMGQGQQLDSWMYSQITVALDNLNAVHDAMDGDDGIKEHAEVNEKMKVFMKNIVSKMIPSVFGASSNAQMREEMKDAIANAIEPILLKYDYIVEKEEINENTRVPMTLYPADFRKYFSDINYDTVKRQYDRDIAPEIAQADNGKWYEVSSTYNRYSDRVIKLKSTKAPK